MKEEILVIKCILSVFVRGGFGGCGDRGGFLIGFIF